MILLERRKRSSFFTGFSPGLVAGLTVFVFTVLGFYFLGTRYETSLTPCLLLQTTGVPCSLCGGTRSSLSLLKGDVGSAFRLNPFVSLLVIAFVVWLIFRLILGIRISFSGSRRWISLVVVIFFLLNWIYVLRA